MTEWSHKPGNRRTGGNPTSSRTTGSAPWSNGHRSPRTQKPRSAKKHRRTCLALGSISTVQRMKENIGLRARQNEPNEKRVQYISVWK
jgi:hypothetical protein